MRYLLEEEFELILQLHAENWKIKDIAKKMTVCEATVSNYIHGRTAPRYLKKGRKPKIHTVQKSYPFPCFTEEDFSILPDDVLFEHVRECNFIG